MTTNKLFLAASLGLVLAACAGEQAETTAAEEVPAAGEMPQAGDEGVVTGSPEENLVGTETEVGDTTADASTMIDPALDPNAPATATDPLADPAMPPATDPALEDPTQADPPPPSQ